jgi:hypothetical protein
MPFDDEPLSGDKSKEVYLRDCLGIIPEAISEELIRVPGEIAYWNARYSDALRVALDAKAERKRMYAALYIEIRNALTSASPPKPTEAMIDASVIDHPDYDDAVRAENKAEAGVKEAFGHLDAIRAKKDVLMTLGGILREEMRGDPILRDEVALARDGRRG